MSRTHLSILLCLLLCIATASCKPTKKRQGLKASDMSEPANARFLSTFAGPDQDPWFACAIMTFTDGAPKGAAALCVKRPIAGRADMLLGIAFYSPPLEGQPLMQLQIFAADEHGSPNYIDPVIMSSLTDEQAEAVFATGVPATLVDAMVQAADDAGWDATKWKRTNARWLYVDAEPHFVEP